MDPIRDAPRVLVVGADHATRDLLGEWLAELGWRVCVEEADGGDGCYALVVVDVPYPRHAAAQLRQLSDRHAGARVLALSATFHPSVERRGDVARSLGVAAVLPKPLRRETLVALVKELAGPPS